MLRWNSLWRTGRVEKSCWRLTVVPCCRGWGARWTRRPLWSKTSRVPTWLLSWQVTTLRSLRTVITEDSTLQQEQLNVVNISLAYLSDLGETHFRKVTRYKLQMNSNCILLLLYTMGYIKRAVRAFCSLWQAFPFLSTNLTHSIKLLLPCEGKGTELSSYFKWGRLGKCEQYPEIKKQAISITQLYCLCYSVFKIPMKVL